MKLDKYWMIGIAALLITGFLWGAHWYRNKEADQVSSKVKANAENLVRPYSPTLGKPGAKVTVVEFFDPECEACSAVYPDVKVILKEFEGKARLVLRYMPLHKNSFHAASVLEGARKQGKYWEALELMFSRQREWADHHTPRPELLMGYMKMLGLDVETLLHSVKDSEIESRIRQDEEDGKTLGVTGTPTFFINGELLQQLGFDQLRAAIAAKVKE